MGRRIVLVLSVALFVAVLLVTAAPAMAQGYAPKTGGPAVGSVLLPAVLMLVGAGVLAYTILRNADR